MTLTNRHIAQSEQQKSPWGQDRSDEGQDAEPLPETIGGSREGWATRRVVAKGRASGGRYEKMRVLWRTVAAGAVATTLAGCGSAHRTADQSQVSTSLPLLTTTTTSVSLAALLSDLNSALEPAQADEDKAKQALAVEEAIVLPMPPSPGYGSGFDAYYQASQAWNQRFTAAEAQKEAASAEVNSDYGAVGRDLETATSAILNLPWPADLDSDVRSFVSAAAQLAEDDMSFGQSTDKVSSDVATYNVTLGVLESDVGGSPIP